MECMEQHLAQRWRTLRRIGNPPDSDPPPGVDYGMAGPAPTRPLKTGFIGTMFYLGLCGVITSWGVHHIDIVHWASGRTLRWL
jgi:hypothetical protein